MLVDRSAMPRTLRFSYSRKASPTVSSAGISTASRVRRGARRRYRARDRRHPDEPDACPSSVAQPRISHDSPPLCRCECREPAAHPPLDGTLIGVDEPSQPAGRRARRATTRHGVGTLSHRAAVHRPRAPADGGQLLACCNDDLGRCENPVTIRLLDAAANKPLTFRRLPRKATQTRRSAAGIPTLLHIPPLFRRILAALIRFAQTQTVRVLVVPISLSVPTSPPRAGRSTRRAPRSASARRPLFAP